MCRLLPANRHLPWVVFALMTPPVLLAGCSSSNQSGAQAAAQRGELTRQAAARLINQAPKFKTVQSIPIDHAAMTGGVKEGFWNEGRALTTAGRQHFTEVMFGVPQNRVLPAQPATRVVTEVTGIADHPLGDSVKEAKFLWKYDGLDAVVARFTGQGSESHPGTAFFRLYDDGWRVENVEVEETARVAFRLDADQADDVERARRETAYFEKTAKTPTRTIATYEFIACPDEWGEQRSSAQITDANVTVQRTKGSGRVGTFGYWELPGIQFFAADVECGLPGRGRRKPGAVLRLGLAEFRVTEDLQRAEAMVEEIRAAHSQWNTRFPDRNTWLPVGAPTTAVSVPASEESCYSGIWKENENNGLTWRFTENANALTIERTDGFVSGAFTRNDPKNDWTGELRWQNGDVWRNVVLYAASNGCREVRTNQRWWFRR